MLREHDPPRVSAKRLVEVPRPYAFHRLVLGERGSGSPRVSLHVEREAPGLRRTTRFTRLLHLPRLAERGRLRIKTGPALAEHGAEAVRDAITSTIATLPDQLRRSLTWDQGAEMAQHAQLRIDTGLQVFFCDPRSP